MTRLQIIEKTINQMPKIFNSSEFNKAAIKNGYPKKLIVHNGLYKFIRMYAFNETPYSKTWTKKSKNEVAETVQEVKADPTFILNEKDCIDFLKSKGYKIMKPIQEYIEL